MSARRDQRPLVPVQLQMRRAQRRWEILASQAGIEACDARLCAKLAKSRKLAWRRERRVVRCLLRDVTS